METGKTEHGLAWRLKPDIKSQKVNLDLKPQHCSFHCVRMLHYPGCSMSTNCQRHVDGGAEMPYAVVCRTLADTTILPPSWHGFQVPQ